MAPQIEGVFSVVHVIGILRRFPLVTNCEAMVPQDVAHIDVLIGVQIGCQE